MATMKKLLGFRQLSLNCDTPQTPSKRRNLKKQFSEDRRDFKHWSDDLGIQIDLNDRNPFVKHAWIDPADNINDEPVIIKKCGENRRATSGKLTRQGSLDNSKQDFQGRLRQNLKSTEEKPNLRIFLAQNSQDYPQEYISTVEKEEQPKIFKPLTVGVVNNDKSYFKIRKNTRTKINTPDTLWQVPNKKPVPELNQSPSEQPQDNVSEVGNYVKPIASVIIRPSTAASKREMFQKRTNSAFSTTVTTKEPQKPRRPLVRSSSAPCKPEHLKSKLIFQKHRKTFKKIQLKTATKTYDIDKNEENSKCTTVQGSDVVTMVSLVSPEGSDCEEEEEEEDEDIKMKTKNVYIEKSTPEPKSTPKIMTLRKAVKTVSFQQSSIHAIRSFSASFPARRSSVSAAMMMNNSLNSSKVQEKRSTNSTKPDDDERMPKRRLVRNNKEDGKTASFDRVDNAENVQNDNQTTSNETTTLNTATKPEDNQNQHNLEMEKKSDDAETSSKESEMDNLDLKSPKEKQCWNMYCKMTEKGINVSFDTILRGMLTPTEYRLSKKHSLVPPPNPEPPKST